MIFGRRVSEHKAWAAALAVAFGGAGAIAQPLKLPDFRQELEARSSVLCDNCATVRSVRELSTPQQQRDIPGITTPPVGTPHDQVLVGAVFVRPLAENTEGFVGGVGTPEMRARFATTSYEITLRMDDGSYKFVQRRDGARFKVGDRVRVVQGTLQPI